MVHKDLDIGGRMTTTTDPPWLTTLRKENSGFGFSYEADGAMEILHVTMKPIPDVPYLDLSHVPTGLTVKLLRPSTSYNVPLGLESVPSHIELIIIVVPNATPLELVLVDVPGPISLEANASGERPAVIVTANQPIASHLKVTGCILEVLAPDGVRRIDLHDSRVSPHIVQAQPQGFKVAELTANGDCSIHHGVEIDRLLLGSGARLELPITQLLVNSLAPEGDRSSDVQLLSAQAPPGQSQEPCVLQAKSVEAGLFLQLLGPTRLEVADEAKDLEVRGPGELMIHPNAAVQRLTLVDQPRLSVGEYAVVTAMTGEAFLIRRAAHTQLVGAADSGLELLGISTDLTGATLENIKIPNTPRGRQELAQIEQATHFTPYIRELPTAPLEPYYVWQGNQSGRVRAIRRILLGSQRPVTDAGLAKRTGDYEYVRAMARLAATKGAPGSVRTKLAWSMYRLRNLVVGKWERCALTGYRMIGYGERAGPAVITWIVVAALVIPLRYGLSPDFSPDGIGHFFEHWGSNILSPLHLLHLGGSDEDDGNHWHLLAKILVAAPFVTAILAARKYLKGDRDVL
jgi:hypothetical protein